MREFWCVYENYDEETLARHIEADDERHAAEVMRSLGFLRPGMQVHVCPMTAFRSFKIQVRDEIVPVEDEE